MLERRLDLRRGEPVVGHRLGLCTGEGSERPGLVPPAVRILADDDLVARSGVRFERELVGHRPARNEQRRLGTDQRRDALFECLDRWVLAVDVVTDLRVGHRLAHRLRRTGHGVGA